MLQTRRKYIQDEGMYVRVWGQSGNRVVTEVCPELTVKGQPDCGPPLASQWLLGSSCPTRSVVLAGGLLV